MMESLTEFAHRVSASTATRNGFEAIERIQAGPVRAEAHVRFRAPGRVALEFVSYESPIADLDALLGGDVELTPAELVGMRVVYDGARTWHIEPKGETVLTRLGRTLYEPVPGFDTLAELGFLPDLTRDFLLRDAGEEEVHGRSCRVIAMKPKRIQVSQLLRLITFPIVRASIAFDVETAFPARIRFRTSDRVPLAMLLGPDSTVEIEYRDVRPTPPDETSFSPPLGGKEVRLLEERSVPSDELEAALPFPIHLAQWKELGYALPPGSFVVTLNQSGDRGYVALPFVSSSSEGEPSRVTLRIGNYLSRQMARRRTEIAERGEEATTADDGIRILDRKQVWDEKLPAVEAHAPLETTWEENGVFSVVASEGLEREALMKLVSDLRSVSP
jgi:hypothetical protein